MAKISPKLVLVVVWRDFVNNNKNFGINGKTWLDFWGGREGDHPRDTFNMWQVAGWTRKVGSSQNPTLLLMLNSGRDFFGDTTIHLNR